MKHTDLEPGFLQAFRLFIVTRIVFWVIIGPILIVMQMAGGDTQTAELVVGMNIIERLTLPNIAPVLAVELLLLVLLTVPQMRRRLGRWFLPVTMLLGLVPVLVGYYWWPSENPLQTPFAIFSFVMLVLVAWQYSFRYVLAYVLGLTLYQVWLNLPLPRMPLSIDLGWLLLQGAMMLLVGYVIVQLVSIQREQRFALAQAYEQQAAVNARLQRYAAALEELTISRERNRLARELHDTLAHSLSAVTVQLEAVRTLWDLEPEGAREMLAKADETARQGLTEARRAVRALRASPLQTLGLARALSQLAQKHAEQAGAALDLQVPEQLDGVVPPTVEQGVYRIAQETLENIVRHAEARTIAVRMEQGGSRLSLTIEDDGRGMDADTMRAWGAGEPDRFGLRGMKERAGMIGGRLEIASQPGQGTRVHLTVPL